ncbi:unnamed protein product, partial [Effrenium voratum]
LRATVLENRELVAKMAMGLSRFNLEELTKMCVDLKIALPTKQTKGELTKLLRTAYSGHANEEIDFGRHKGTLYKDVPMEYQKWAIKETEANEEPSLNLVKFTAKKVKALEVDIEEVAVIPVPDTKVDTKVMVDMKVTTKAANQDKNKKMATTSTTARKRETATDSDDSWMRMETQSDPEALEKIMQLENEVKRRQYWQRRKCLMQEARIAREIQKLGVDAAAKTYGENGAGDDKDYQEGMDRDLDNNGGFDQDEELDIGKCHGKRVKKATRKMLTSWVRKSWQAFALLTSALATPLLAEAQATLVEPILDIKNVFCRPEVNEEQPYVLEIFSGKARITQAFAAKGKVVMEPRDICNGHDIRSPETRRAILDDINEFKPKLVAGGRHFIMENPEHSAIWEVNRIKNVKKDLRLHESNLDMCGYGLQAVTDGRALKKPTKLLVSHYGMAEDLGRRCNRQHDHGQTAGTNTAASACYTWEFARAVVRATEKVEKMLHSAYVADVEIGMNDEEGDEELVADHEWQGAAGITLPKTVPKQMAAALRRVHQNLGHPSNTDLARHLRLSGATDAAVKGAEQLRCQTCLCTKRPGPQRPVKLVLPMDFNDEVAVDIFYLYDKDQMKHTVLSAMDMASGYHVCRTITSRLSKDLAETVRQMWLEWAGSPKRMVCDQERGFQKDYVDRMEQQQIHVKYIAGQAHWQLGSLERQQGWLRSMWDKVVEHEGIDYTEVDWTLAQLVHAKNSLRRRDGYSPSQWVFGVEPRMEHGLRDGGHDGQGQPDTVGGAWSRKTALQRAARKAFYESQANETMKRAALGRPRVRRHEYQTGDIVYIYRVMKTAGGAGRVRQGAGQWIGPGTVIGSEGESIWVSRGGRCLLCAKEHLRPAESEELGTLFQAQSMQRDLKRLMERIEDDDVEDEEIFKEVPAVLEKTEALWTTQKRTPKTMAKQQDKEIAWKDIPENEKPLYLQAEQKQWQEHLLYGAVRVLSVDESRRVKKEVDPSRILTARFAYRDKNAAKEESRPERTTEAKSQALYSRAPRP